MPPKWQDYAGRRSLQLLCSKGFNTWHRYKIPPWCASSHSLQQCSVAAWSNHILHLSSESPTINTTTRQTQRHQVFACFDLGDLAQFLICLRHCLKPPFLCFFVSSLYRNCSVFLTCRIIWWNTSSTHWRLAAELSKNGQLYWSASAWPSTVET